MSDTESFESVVSSYDDFTWIGRDGVKRAIDRLKAAHDREIRDTAQQEYDRGYIDGEHSMDAEHRAVAMRLRQLPLDGGSHENLSQIARAVYHSDWGWTRGACAALRDELVRLMGGVSDGNCACAGGGACDADCGRDSVEQVEVTDERLADDCGADSGCGDGGGGVHMAGVTDELRKWVEGQGNGIKEDQCWILEPHDERKLLAELAAIADRIDAQFDRICAQHEAVLQSTIDEMAGEIDKMRKEVIELREQRHELQVECDDAYAERDELMKQRAEMTAELARRLEQRDAARARTDELSDELLRTRRERDELRAKLAIIRGAVDG